MRLPLRIALSHQSGPRRDDQLIEFEAGNDALIRRPPSLVVCLRDCHRVGLLWHVGFRSGLCSCAEYEQASRGASSPTFNAMQAVWITGAKSRQKLRSSLREKRQQFWHFAACGGGDTR